MTSETPPDAPATEEKPAEKKPPGNAALLGLLIPVAVVVAIVVHNSGDDEAPPRESAYYACEHFVSQTLVAPDTADFGGYDTATVTSAGDDTYRVRGTVTAENSFGAPLLQSFDCTVHDNGDDWSTVGIPTVG